MGYLHQKNKDRVLGVSMGLHDSKRHYYRDNNDYREEASQIQKLKERISYGKNTGAD